MTWIIALLCFDLLALPVLFLFGVLTGSFITYRSRLGLAPVPTVSEMREGLRLRREGDDAGKKPPRVMPPEKL